MSRKTRIEEALATRLSPIHLEVIDESRQHAVPPGAESHIKVVAVSPQFAGQPLLARHRLVNGALAGEFATGLHALSIHAWTPEEWAMRDAAVPESPPCRGGSKEPPGGQTAA